MNKLDQVIGIYSVAYILLLATTSAIGLVQYLISGVLFAVTFYQFLMALVVASIFYTFGHFMVYGFKES